MTGAVLGHSQGTLPVLVWVPTGLCGWQTRSLLEGESQELPGPSQGGVGLGSDPTQENLD